MFFLFLKYLIAMEGTHIWHRISESLSICWLLHPFPLNDACLA